MIKNHKLHICWIDIPVDDLNRSKSFYTQLFDWKIEADRSHLSSEYFMFSNSDGTDLEEHPHHFGGILKRMHPDHSITVYFSVPSIDQYIQKLKDLGGHVIKAKKAIPGWGYFVICADTENNHFALWEQNKEAA